MSKPEKNGLWCKFPGTSFFNESAIKYLADYRFWILALVWLTARMFAIWGLTPDFFVEGCYQAAGDWLDGYTPYANFKVDYPPGPLLLFTLLRIFIEAPVAYGYGFAFLMLLADLGILLLLYRIGVLACGSQDHGDTVRRYMSFLPGLIYVFITAFFGHLPFQRYDLILALLLTAVIYAALRKKQPLVDLLLAVGIWFNLTALIWIPLLWWYDVVGRSEASPADKSLKMGPIVRILLPRAAVLASCLVVLFSPFIILAGRSLGYIVQIPLVLGTQLESSATGILMLGAKILGAELATEFTHRANYLTGLAGSWGAGVSRTVSIIVFLIFTVYLARRIHRPQNAMMRRVWLIRGMLATSLALLATSRIFLPQFLLWVAPLTALICSSGSPRDRGIGRHLLAANLLTMILFYFYYAELEKLQILPGILLLGRNGLVIWAAVSLLALRPPAAYSAVTESEIGGRSSQYLNYLPVILLFVWGTLAAFCPVSSNDLWLLLREAGDMVASGRVPKIELYSAVAAGRPYLAHEWLSGLVFLGVFKLGGGEALTVFRACAMLAMLFLLWFSLKKTDRTFSLAAPLLALAAYTILVRVFVRPHIFTHLFICVWIFLLERWRRERRLSYLIGLVPLQVLWANLHGGYIFALVLGAVVTGTTTLLVLRPDWSKDESYDWSDVKTFAALTLACFAASMINPSGLRLLEFSLTIGMASDYIKQVVFEWASPLGMKYARSYGREAAICMFSLIWLGLALTVKRRPLLDAILALVASLMSVQAIRFVSYIGMIGFPIAVRTWRTATDDWVDSSLATRRPLIEAALFTLLLASTLTYGFPYGQTKHRPVGWGLGGRMPYEATRYLSEHGFEGNIFNDYGDGAFLIYHLYPKVRPVMDSRIDVYGSELSGEYFASRQDPIKFFRYLNKYNVSIILLRKTQDNYKINQYLNYIPATKLLLETNDRYLYTFDPELLAPDLKQQISQ